MKKLLCMLMVTIITMTYAAQEDISAVKRTIADRIDGNLAWHIHTFGKEYQALLGIERLLKKNPQLLVQDPVFANTNLLKATGKGLYDVVEFFIEAQVNLDTPGTDGKTALMIAANNDDSNLLELLIAHGANPSIQNEQDGNKTARDYALGKGIAKKFDAYVKKREKFIKLYKANKKDVNSLLNNHIIKDVSNIVTDYAFADTNAEMKALNATQDCVIQ